MSSSAPNGGSAAAARLSTGGTHDLTTLEGILAEAVQRGAPLFNQGDARGCVSAYTQAANDCLSLRPSNQQQVARLEAGLREAGASVSDNDAAWALRRMIDDVSAVERGERQTRGAKAMISDAIAIGVPQYNAGDHTACYNTYKQCVTSLVERLMDGRDGIKPHIASSIKRELQNALTDAEGSDQGVGMDVRAWKLRKAMDKEWVEVSDRVMGGVSVGSFAIQGGIATFSGQLSTDNNGGFASVRSPNLGRNLPDCKGIAITCKGDGNRYKIQCRTHGSSDGLVYQADFVPESSGFSTVSIPLQKFNPTFRGSVVPNAVALTGCTIKSVGLITSKLSDVGHKNPEFKVGPFSLEVKKIETY
mmetsp:Transcript_4246/g.9838  ORF Transcript_4246/g.9838 Transcript_4246/m.9838 type:complete len:361 (+) Transcript_4246:301-1383(+)